MGSKSTGAAVLALALAACGPFPRDVEGTTEQIGRDRTVRVAFAELEADEAALARRYAARVAARLDARVRPMPNGSTERLFARLEEGELDLVLAEVATDSPWRAHVAVLEPLATRAAGQRVLTLSPVARNGENRWIGMLEREARNMVGDR